jgi:CHAD domain-containing protein
MTRLRRAAGAVRMCDVHRSLLAEMLKDANDQERAAIEVALMLLADDAQRARHELFEAAKRRSARRLPSGAGRWLRRGRSQPCDSDSRQHAQTTPVTHCAIDLRHAGDAALAELSRTFLTAAAEDLSRRDNLHRMRLEGKTLRYAVEIFGANATDPDALVQVHESLIHLQDRLGVINDHEEVAHRLTRYAGNLETEVSGGRKEAEVPLERPAASSSLAPVMRRLADHFEARCNEGVVDFLEWWHGEEASNFRRLLEDLAAAAGDSPESVATETATTTAKELGEGEAPDGETVRERSDAEVVVLAQRNGSAIEPALASAARNGDER